MLLHTFYESIHQNINESNKLGKLTFLLVKNSETNLGRLKLRLHNYLQLSHGSLITNANNSSRAPLSPKPRENSTIIKMLKIKMGILT